MPHASTQAQGIATSIRYKSIIWPKFRGLYYKMFAAPAFYSCVSEFDTVETE